MQKSPPPARLPRPPSESLRVARWPVHYHNRILVPRQDQPFFTYTRTRSRRVPAACSPIFLYFFRHALLAFIPPLFHPLWDCRRRRRRRLFFLCVFRDT